MPAPAETSTSSASSSTLSSPPPAGTSTAPAAAVATTATPAPSTPHPPPAERPAWVAATSRDIRDEADFDAALAAAIADDGVLLVMAHATWCRKCKACLVQVRKLLAEGGRPALYVGFVNVNEVAGVPRRMGVEVMPTFQVWGARGKLGQYVGGESPTVVGVKIRELVDAHFGFCTSLRAAASPPGGGGGGGAAAAPLQGVTAAADSRLPPPAPLGYGPRSWGRGLARDLRRRLPVYLADWADGAHPRSAATVVFIYFTALAPAVAFGALTSIATGGVLGVNETLLSAAVGGLVYAATSGQPTVLLGPTGLTLAFTTALAAATTSTGLPFLPVFGWTGVWGGALLIAAGVANAAAGLAGVTAFTTDIFNALIGGAATPQAAAVSVGLAIATVTLARVLAAARSWGGGRETPPPAGAEAAEAIEAAAAAAAAATATDTSTVGPPPLARPRPRPRRRWVLPPVVAATVADFGPSLALVAVTAAALGVPWLAASGVPTLTVPATGATAAAAAAPMAGGGGIAGVAATLRAAILHRRWGAGLWTVPLGVRLGCAAPGAALALLFFLDQNISSRCAAAAAATPTPPSSATSTPPSVDGAAAAGAAATFSDGPGGSGGSSSGEAMPVLTGPSSALAVGRSGGGYHLDMVVLGLLTAALSVAGLPWMCAATAPTLCHIRCLRRIDSATGAVVSGENRLTGAAVAVAVGATLVAAPALGAVPLPVVCGLFWYMGGGLVAANAFLRRLPVLARLPPLSRIGGWGVGWAGPACPLPPEGIAPAADVWRYTAVQAGCLAVLLAVQSVPGLALAFPVAIGGVLAVRSGFVRRSFAASVLRVLDDEVA
ncbi:hypothetical protein MMPV_002025 [Pyropia vietnamensis]